MLWYLDVFGDRYDLNHLSAKSRAVFQCHDAGIISDVRVRGFTDNYPYFDIKCKIDGFAVCASHKLSYMIGAGGISWIGGLGRKLRKIPEVVSGQIGYSVFSDGSDVKFITKSEIESFIGEAQIECWITDPRLHYLALLSLLYESDIIGKWTKVIPSWRQAIDILTRFGLFHRFCEKPTCPDDAYDNMSRFLRSLNFSEPESFLAKFSPGLEDCVVANDETVLGNESRDIFLLNCHLSGTSHANAAKGKADTIKPGLLLTLRREPANKYDGRAIAVYLSSGERIGYVPQKHNSVISRLMDAGKLIFAKVTEAELKGDWLHARMDIFLKDFA